MGERQQKEEESDDRADRAPAAATAATAAVAAAAADDDATDRPPPTVADDCDRGEARLIYAPVFIVLLITYSVASSFAPSPPLSAARSEGGGINFAPPPTRPLVTCHPTGERTGK